VVKARRAEQPDDARTANEAAEVEGEDTEGQSLHNYELVRAVSRERANEAARIARDSARAREAREAKNRR
jgi:hypothetical protein